MFGSVVSALALLLLPAAGCASAPPQDDSAPSPSGDTADLPEDCGVVPMGVAAVDGGTLTTATARVYTGDRDDGTGVQLLAAGDLDADSCGDLLVQAVPGAHGANPDPLHSFLSGPLPESGALSTVATATWIDEEQHLHTEWSGNPTAAGVDLDGDTAPDVAFAPTIGSASYAEVERAQVFVLVSGAAPPATVQELPVLIRDDPSCERASLLAGDWNGDEQADLAMFSGAVYESTAWGAAWWGPFTAERACTAPDAWLPLPSGDDADLFFGGSPTAGDLNGDGQDELVLVAQTDWATDSVRTLLAFEATPGGDFDVDQPLLRMDDVLTSPTLLADLDGNGHPDLAVSRVVDSESYVKEWLVFGEPLTTTHPDDARLRIRTWWQSEAADGGALLGGSGSTLLVSYLHANDTYEPSFCALAPGASGEMSLGDCDLRFGPEVFSSYLRSFAVVPDVDGFGTQALAVGGGREEAGETEDVVLVWGL